MKKTARVLALLLAAVLLMTGCSATFTITGSGSKNTIKVQKAPDGTIAETNNFSIKSGRTTVITSSLDKGKLRIDFVEVTIFHQDKGPDEVMYGSVVESVTVGPGETLELNIAPGDYVIQMTAVGETNGTVVVDHVNK